MRATESNERRALREQRTLLTDRWLEAVALVAVVVLLLALATGAVRDVPLAELVDDPSATTGAHPLTGVMSNLGVLAWWTGAVIALFAALTTSRMGGDRTVSRFLLTGGLLTGYLAIDDLFLIHDELLNLTPLPQPAFLALLVMAFSGYLYAYRRVVATTEWALLVLAGSLFGASLVIDFGSDLGKHLHSWTTPSGLTFVEDGLKWLGIVLWATYLVRVSATAVVRSGKEADRD